MTILPVLLVRRTRCRRWACLWAGKRTTGPGTFAAVVTVAPIRVPQVDRTDQLQTGIGPARRPRVDEDAAIRGADRMTG